MKWIGALLTVFLLAGCAGSSDLESKEAVQQGLLDYLSNRSGLNVESMNVEVTSVVFRGNEADATVSFQAKGATDPAAGMQMQYTLERQDNRWVVKGKAGSEGAPHGGTEMNPHGGAAPDAGGQMPAGHPPVDAPASTEQ